MLYYNTKWVLASMLVAFPFQLNLTVAATTPVGKAVQASCNPALKAWKEAVRTLSISNRTTERGRPAIVKFERASKMYQECNNNLQAAITLGHAAEAYAQLGEKQKAIEYYQRALSLAQTVNTRIGRGHQKYFQERIQYFKVTYKL